MWPVAVHECTEMHLLTCSDWMELIRNASRHFFAFFILRNFVCIALIIRNLSGHSKVRKLEKMDKEMYKGVIRRPETLTEDSSEYEDATDTLPEDVPPPFSPEKPLKSRKITPPPALPTLRRFFLQKSKTIFEKLKRYSRRNTRKHRFPFYESYKDTELYSTKRTDILGEIFEITDTIESTPKENPGSCEERTPESPEKDKPVFIVPLSGKELTQKNFPEKLQTEKEFSTRNSGDRKTKRRVVDPRILLKLKLVPPKIVLPPRNMWPEKNQVEREGTRRFATGEPRKCQRRNIRKELFVHA